MCARVHVPPQRIVLEVDDAPLRPPFWKIQVHMSEINVNRDSNPDVTLFRSEEVRQTLTTKLCQLTHPKVHGPPSGTKQ